jgi:hypothetical protein
MNSIRKKSVLLLALMFLTSTAFAQFAVPLRVLGNGASQMSGADFRVRGTIGQGVVGVQTGTANRAFQGFWYAAPRIILAVDRPLETPLPGSFALEPVYPNPFNPSTTIRFTVPHAARVGFRVYDIMGRLAATFAEQNVSAGEHSLIWNASGFASGTYTLVMTAPGFQTTRKMVLLK